MHYAKKTIIVGMDALDPVLLEKFINDGLLPNFARLKETGTYSRLHTVMPPESEVVWTSFFTGLNPGKHGIFDFIMRDPATYLPYLSLYSPVQPKALTIGPIKIPYQSSRIEKRYKGVPFWEITSQHKIPTYIYFCPNTFPPDKVHGKFMSGMGVPDVRGTMGTFSFYTTQKLDKTKDIGGLVFEVMPFHDEIKTKLYGPRNTASGGEVDVALGMNIVLDETRKQVEITVADSSFTLQEKTWSDWIPLQFKLNAFSRVHGICKFYLHSVTPHLALYCSPVNFDPRKPFFPISYPRNYTKKLVGTHGFFYTQGMPYPTWAVSEQRMDQDVFLEEAKTILGEREAILKSELKEFKGGVFFFYFEYPDIIQHMFWRQFNTAKKPFESVIAQCYQKMDEILGYIMKQIDDSTVLFVLSDHGFGPFNTSIHLNSWLRDQGLLVLKDNALQGKELLKDVDWSKTKAYSLGLCGIYLNMKGREARGIVRASEREAIIKHIQQGLETWRDHGGKQIVLKAYARENLFTGVYRENAPDVIVGFNKGFRASWQTALGAVPEDAMSDNVRAWSGDHIFDASLVPGVILSNQKFSLKRTPRIIDIIPTVLRIFQIDPPKDLDGVSFL